MSGGSVYDEARPERLADEATVDAPRREGVEQSCAAGMTVCWTLPCCTAVSRYRGDAQSLGGLWQSPNGRVWIVIAWQVGERQSKWVALIATAMKVKQCEWEGNSELIYCKCPRPWVAPSLFK